MRKKNKKRSGKIFLRTFTFTLILLLCPSLVLVGSAKAYEAIQENGFAQKGSALQIRAEQTGTTLKFFDYERTFQNGQGGQFLTQSMGDIWISVVDFWEGLFKKEPEE